MTLPLNDLLETIFSAQGKLADAMPNYRPRHAQIMMAQRIAEILQKNQTYAAQAGEETDNDDPFSLMIEAETGIGKTFAYLVPVMLFGGKAIISTGTKHLQDQLFFRDIPAILNVLALPIQVAMLKGRANYLCHHYLQKTTEQTFLISSQETHDLQEIRRFTKYTLSGDKAELASVPEHASIWNLVTSTKENCLGQDCAYFKECFVMQARKKAQQADLVIVNHHLFFADILLKDIGFADLLPAANTIIFDEAHQIPNTASLFFGETLSTNELLKLARDVLREGLSEARDACDWHDLCDQLEYRVKDLRLAFDAPVMKIAFAQLAENHPCFAALNDLMSALEAMMQRLENQAQRAESLAACLKRALENHGLLTKWLHHDDEESQVSMQHFVKWLEVFPQSVHLHQTPLSVAPMFSEQRHQQQRAWIFTSATLSVKGDFSYYAAQLGLNKESALSLPSPFDYAQQAILYVPDQIPLPSAPDFLSHLLAQCIPIIEATEGGIFILCTSLRAVDFLAEKIVAHLQKQGIQKTLLVQGQVGKTELLARFRASGQAILIGSHSFWEGVDVSGETLSVVIIDKLPFAAPDEPILAARLEKLSKNGVNPFMHHQLPEAIIHLKQGAGRLIRSETDHGVLMICDRRLVEKSYGRKIWQSLPPFKRTRNQQVVIDFLKQHVSAAQE